MILSLSSLCAYSISENEIIPVFFRFVLLVAVVAVLFIYFIEFILEGAGNKSISSENAFWKCFQWAHYT